MIKEFVRRDNWLVINKACRPGPHMIVSKIACRPLYLKIYGLISLNTVITLENYTKGGNLWEPRLSQ